MDFETRTALSEALYSELQARANYRAAVARFGSMYPFVLLVEAVEQQIDALRPVCERHHIEPAHRSTGPVELPTSLDQLLERQAAAEMERANRYEELLGEADDPVARLVLTRLEEACRYQRLPLLRRAREPRRA